MATLRKVLAKDFEAVYSLLPDMQNPDLTDEYWWQHFVDHCVPATAAVFSLKVTKMKIISMCGRILCYSDVA